jgi:hypothetical protein
MSTEARKWAWPKRLPPMDKLVLLALADLADPDECFASKGKLSEMTGISTRRVGDVLARLQAAGMIKLVASSRIENGKRMACDWLLPIADDGDAASSRTPRHQGRSVTNDDDAASPTMMTQRHPNQKNQKETKQSAPAISSPSLPSSPPKPSRAKFDPCLLPLPHTSARFASTWADWVEHRRQIRKPLTEVAAKRLLAQLAKFTESAAIDKMDRAMAAGWQGCIFPQDLEELKKVVRMVPNGRTAADDYYDALERRVGGIKA